MSAPDAMRCPLCGTDNKKSFEVITQEAQAERRCRALRCACGVIYLDDYLEDRTAIYGENYTVWAKSREADEPMIAASKKTAFAEQLARIAPFIGPKGKKILDIGTGKGYLLDVAERMGFECHGVELSSYAAGKAAERFPGRIFTGTLEQARYPDGTFDVIAMTDLIEHIGDPQGLMKEVRRVLRPGGLVFIITPDTDAATRKMLGKRWFQYKYEHVVYWNARSLRRLLGSHGFEALAVKHNSKRFRLSYYNDYFKKYSFLGPVGRMFPRVYALLPKKMREMSFTNPVTGEMLVIAKKK